MCGCVCVAEWVSAVCFSAVTPVRAKGETPEERRMRKMAVREERKVCESHSRALSCEMPGNETRCASLIPRLSLSELMAGNESRCVRLIPRLSLVGMRVGVSL